MRRTRIASNSETLPSGSLTQIREYDTAGNLTSLTDYNGNVTTYTYDNMNRLLTKVADLRFGEPTVRFTCTSTGKRASMEDASGTTIYTYDNQDRLKTKATPQGTLSYTYDAAGNVASIQSSNTHGTSVAYTWDNLNRLSTVVDNNLPAGQNTTTYTSDPASNLATVTYPNGLSSQFTHDTLNRLTDLNGYHYQLSATGNRQSATEPGGRTLNWTYDNIYRLTTETINLNTSVSYTLDPVGNRLSQTSNLPGIPTTSFTYDANDRILSTEVYDNNGNTTASGGRTFAYDFENRLKSMNGTAVTLQYDVDGNRVAKTVAGVTTRYLVDDLNPTGYAQVVEEVVNGGVQRTYTYGIQRISQNQLINSAWTPSFYGYDGFGSVRSLTDSTRTVTDTYDYDAWGNAVNATGSTPSVYLYRGEEYDPDLNLYCLRARYFNPRTGRFLTRDPEAGKPTHPQTLHKYLYTFADPVNMIDPTGRAGAGIGRILVTAFLLTGLPPCVTATRRRYSAMPLETKGAPRTGVVHTSSGGLMKSTLLFLAVGAAGFCWGQAPPDCKPNPLNVPEAKYPCIFPDNRVMYRVNAPNAQAVRVGNTSLTKGPDNIWSGTTEKPAVEGFHYYGVNIDGATVADPSTRTYFGSGWWNSGIEIPAPDQDFYQPKEVPRGRVSEQWYYSKVTGKWRRCFVYTPPDYDGGKNKYPVFYLLHGWGEDETAWFNQGRVDYIMDNLIAEKKAKPMIIVMDNLNAVKPGESAMRFAGRGLVPDPSDHPAPPPTPPAARGGAPATAGGRGPAGPGAGQAGRAGAAGRGPGMLGNSAFTEMMFADLIPMVERTYRALPGPANRAMAGLSMGGAQTRATTMANVDKFAYIGLFSGGNITLAQIENPAAFKKQIKAVFFGNGQAEGGTSTSKPAAEELKKAGINAVFYESPRTAHEFLTWRRCLREFAPMLFK